ncbi:hypothetical protein [Microbacterium sp. H1-D42]|uniref:hypothetical protein n=1 Tax=Microbacterium sp. H1-D42 TaxID=2925844 RepID=UPI001F5391D7|nr:hypothetical protein [Microbacterium sp. H1-D42]UNK72130.1 hypothetical protein MNR00_06725 [Microbacterium sp. H1-D42]
MDVLEIVRRAAPQAEIDDATVAATRHRVMSEIRGVTQGGKRPRRARLLGWSAGVVGAGAAAAIGAVVITNLIPVDPGTPGVPPGLLPAPASASEVLERAADRTAEGDALVPQTGQYLRIDETTTLLQFAIPDAATGELMPMGNRENAEAAFTTERTTALYVPANREDEWVWDLSEPWTVGDMWGERASEAARVWQRLEQNPGDTPPVWRLPGGRDPQNPENPDATLDGREEFADMPREPQELLDWFRERSGQTGAAADAAAVWAMTSTLSTALAPAELRAAMFQALALVDGVQVEDPAADLATFTFSASGGDWVRTTTFTLDTERSLITELSDVSLPAGDSIVPAEVPDEHRVVRVTVVDEAP